MFKHSKKFFLTSLLILLSFVFLAKDVNTSHSNYPMKANYYLAQLKDSPSFIEEISKYDLLILTPSQIYTHPIVISKIKKANPDIIILAYVPSQSYNTRYWYSSPVYRHLKPKKTWWLRDSSGNPISSWKNIRNTNMSEEWSDDFLAFVNKQIASIKYVDGIFFDMVSHNISWINHGDIDINQDGKKDTPELVDAIWKKRTEYFFKKAKQDLKTDLIVINGTSESFLQEFVNGRMFENFPTPWEGDGTWSTIMNRLVKNIELNQTPKTMIINSNTANTGKQDDYQTMRFGLTSALLEDAYFSFDFGDENHGQLWYYDEYDVDLGDPQSESFSEKQLSKYVPDIWRRDFENGISVINSTYQKRLVDLGGEYEKIYGTQDRQVNDGSIVSEVELDSNDGIILLKTFSNFKNLLFKNGSFARFFDDTGRRLRNGFFVFEKKYPGGQYIAHLDMNGDQKEDLVLLRGNKLVVLRHDGMRLMSKYPYGASYKGQIKLSIGDIDKNGKMEIVVAPGKGSSAPIKIYSTYGTVKKDHWYPFGEGYRGGYSISISDFGEENSEISIGTGVGLEPRVYSYDGDYNLKRHLLVFERDFRGGINLASGDLNGDGIDELVVGAGVGKKPIIKIFDKFGTQISSFEAYQTNSKSGIDVGVMDINFDGIEDIVSFSSGLDR